MSRNIPIIETRTGTPKKHAICLFAFSLLTACSQAATPVALPTVKLALITSPTLAFLPTVPALTRAAFPTATSVPATLPASLQLSAVFKKFSSNVQIELQGEFVVLKSDGVPPHPSPYFLRSDSRYQAYSGSNPNYRQNPNQIRDQSLVMMVPLNPRQDARHSPTSLGPIGMALDGVALFNQYAGPNQPLTNEINSFDQFNGHPEMNGLYHYHLEPLYLTQKFGRDSLIGFLLDGFPVYGPIENGKTIASNELDQFHGHSHATADYLNGIYHYHVTAEAPYLNGDGFYGTPGRVVR